MHPPFGRSRRHVRLVPVTSRTHWALMTHTVRNDAIWRIPVLLLGVAFLLAGCDPATTTTSSTEAASTSQAAAGSTPSNAAPKPAPKSAKPAAKPPTVAQQQALDAAQSYLDFSGMSRAGLIHQLTSKAGNGFDEADAVWAVDHVKVDWNAEAVEAAKSYLEMGGFSRKSLTQQLTSKAGDQFTKAQAAYAVKKVGL